MTHDCKLSFPVGYKSGRDPVASLALTRALKISELSLRLMLNRWQRKIVRRLFRFRVRLAREQRDGVREHRLDDTETFTHTFGRAG